MLGPRIQLGGGKNYAGENCARNDQIAATALTALALDWKSFNAEAGAPLRVFGGNE